MASCDAAADEVIFDLPPFIRLYKSGRVERLIVNDTLPASLDAATGVASKDVTIDAATNLSVRLYVPTAVEAGEKLPIVVYFHGGGFIIESAASVTYHRYLNALAARARALAVSVDYRRVPEHRLPAAYDDSWAAFAWALAGASSSPAGKAADEPWLAAHWDASRVFLAGDSAGANIAHNVAMRAAAKGLASPSAHIKGVLLMHPFFWDASNTMGSQLEERIRREWKFMTGNDDARVDDPRLSPTSEAAPSLALLPTTCVLVAVAEEDFLAPKARAYYAALLDSGWRGEAELVETPGEDHVFHLGQPRTEAAEGVMDRVAAFITRA
jgi:acetyl esterase/lipase